MKLGRAREGRPGGPLQQKAPSEPRSEPAAEVGDHTPRVEEPAAEALDGATETSEEDPVVLVERLVQQTRTNNVG